MTVLGHLGAIPMLLAMGVAYVGYRLSKTLLRSLFNGRS